ncbi:MULTISPECIES: 2-hydroxychromene-2-carboxylate isomerase [unclassified Ruegeria]|uniref:2-hydroxychromene-2-carboxylate isomerase n=1 Tax=unclassified Ruegeria TaxID=2625375 RepID=UPI0014877D16|nr:MULTISPECIES: 2-hydroxychromene-2-carboxylate isomerase [unclassified Ruegeria]
MGAQLEFWFDFASTYSYLSAMRIEDEAARCGVSVSWHPFLLGPIFADQGWATSPFNLYPAKGRYMWRDMERLCDERGLPLHRPEPFPQNSLKAARLALAVDAQTDRAAFCRAVFSAEFGEGHDISQDSVLTECLRKADLPAESLALAADPAIKAALFEQGARAKALDLFGAPSFVVESEVFWGDDRLDAALSYASAL